MKRLIYLNHLILCLLYLIRHSYLPPQSKVMDEVSGWTLSLLSPTLVRTSPILFALILKRREIFAISNYHVRYPRWVVSVGLLLVAWWNSFQALREVCEWKSTCVIKWTCHIMLNVDNLVSPCEILHGIAT